MRFLFALCFSLLISSAFGQKIKFEKEDFFLTGDAVQIDGPCFQLTEAQLWQGGALWFKKAIDLKAPFEMEIDLSFGCIDDRGADGIVFIFHPKLTTGYPGEGMGFGRLYPSFGIEMDTYENYHLDDPEYDHVAFMKHGYLHHPMGLTLPQPLRADNGNVEDCKKHRVKIIWSPELHTIQFYFDGSLRMEKKINLVDVIFEGDPIVHWGFSSATGGMVNQHMVCLEELKFTTASILSPAAKKALLNGETYTFENLDFSSGSYALPKSATREIDLLIPYLKKDKNKSIILDGYTDSSGNADRNQDLSEKRAKAIADYLQQKGISPNRIKYHGYGAKYPIAPNNTEEGRKKNRRVELRFFQIRT